MFSGLDHRTFQAVIVRVCPDVASGEALNVGVALISKDAAFAGALFANDFNRVSVAFPTVSISRLQKAIRRLQRAYSNWDLSCSPAEVALEAFGNEPGILTISEPICGVAVEMEDMLRDVFTMYVSPRVPNSRETRSDGSAADEPMLMAA